MQSMVEILKKWSTDKPDTVFLADNSGDEYTYAAAWNKVKSVAASLKNRYGIGGQSCIMAECNQDAKYLMLDLACELAGIIFVAVENNAADDRIAGILHDTKSVLFVSENKQIDGIKCVSYNELFADYDADCEFDLPVGEAVAEILYTTGTTGNAKGIMMSNAANVALAENIMYGAEMKSGNVELIPLPISHSHGIRSCYANLLNGGTIVLIDGLLRLNDVFNLMDKYCVTAIDLSPSAAAMLIKLSRGKLWKYADQLDYIEIGTAALPDETKAQLMAGLPNVRMYNFYGSTESGRSCVLEFSQGENRTNCIGRPTKNTKIVFTDDEKNIVKTSKDNHGLLASKGSMNMIGYLNNKALTDQVFDGEYLYTSDYGYIDDEGYVYILGRKDDIINYNGIKISPEEIEEPSNKYEHVMDSACVPFRDKISGFVPKLFLQVADGFDMADFRRYLSDKVEKNRFPKIIEIIDVIPRTYNGKLQRKKLREM